MSLGKIKVALSSVIVNGVLAVQGKECLKPSIDDQHEGRQIVEYVLHCCGITPEWSDTGNPISE